MSAQLALMRHQMKSDERLVYDITEAATILGIGRNAAYEAAKRGELPVVRVGKLLRVPKAALHRMLEQASAATPTRG